MIICEKCGGIASYNSYFGAYICDCGWRVSSQSKKRSEYDLSRSNISNKRIVRNLSEPIAHAYILKKA